MICKRFVRCLWLLRPTNTAKHLSTATEPSVVTFLDCVVHHTEYIKRPAFPTNTLYTEATVQGIGVQYVSQVQYYIATQRVHSAVQLIRQVVCTNLVKDRNVVNKLCSLLAKEFKDHLGRKSVEKRDKYVLSLLDYLDVIVTLSQSKKEFEIMLKDHQLIERLLKEGNIEDIQSLIKRFPDPTVFHGLLISAADTLNLMPLVYDAITDFFKLTNGDAISLCTVLLYRGDNGVKCVKVLQAHGGSRVLFNVLKKMWKFGYEADVMDVLEGLENEEMRSQLRAVTVDSLK